MVKMSQRHLFFSLLFVIFSSASCFGAICEGELIATFDRAPNDDKNGLVTDRVPINVSNLIQGYRRGLFAWKAEENGIGEWYSPPRRGILRLSAVHYSSRDERYFRQQEKLGELRVTFDQDFARVIAACAAQARGTGRWISETHVREYTNLHRAGHAHSVEVWRGDNLVAGLYGVFVNGVFSGESMFHQERDATKLAYRALIEHLRKSGHVFIDTQMNLGLTQKWGGEEVLRYEFLRLIREAQIANRRF